MIDILQIVLMMMLFMGTLFALFILIGPHAVMGLYAAFLLLIVLFPKEFREKFEQVIYQGRPAEVSIEVPAHVKCGDTPMRTPTEISSEDNSGG